MTKATFYFENESIIGFLLVGHTADYDTEEGRIICSAISSAAYMAANTVTEIIGNKADIDVSDGKMSLKLAKPYQSSQDVLQGLKLHLEGLAEQYHDYIAVNMEVQHNA